MVKVKLHFDFLRFVLFYGPPIRNEFSFLWRLPALPAYSFYVSHWEVLIKSSVRLTVTLVLLMSCCGAHLMKCCLTTSTTLLCLNCLRQSCIIWPIASYWATFFKAQRVKSHIVILPSFHYRNISLPTRYICMNI